MVNRTETDAAVPFTGFKEKGPTLPSYTTSSCEGGVPSSILRLSTRVHMLVGVERLAQTRDEKVGIAVVGIIQGVEGSFAHIQRIANRRDLSTTGSVHTSF